MKLNACGIEKWYFRQKGGSNRFFAVKQAELELEPGKVTVLTGRSGSGKTSLLHIMAGLLRPDEGSVDADGQNLYDMDDERLSRFRNGHMGIIPQGVGVLDNLTVMENILLPQGIYGKADGDCLEYARKLLDTMDGADLAEVFAKELSGGERRRVCVARALCRKPEIIFADEPTSDLDDESMKIVLTMLRKAADEGAAVMIVTHDMEALEYADDCFRMNKGVLSPL